MASITQEEARRKVRQQSMKSARTFKVAMTHMVLIVLSVFFLLPFFWMISTSLKPLDQTMVSPPVWIPTLQDTAPYRDPKNPYYEATVMMPTGPATSEMTTVKADVVEHEPNGKLKLKVAEPEDLNDQTFEADPSTLKEVDRQVPIVNGHYNIIDVNWIHWPNIPYTGKLVAEVDKNQTVLITSPASLAGQTYTANSKDVEQVRHVGVLWNNYPKAFTFDSRKLGYIPFLYYFRNTILLCWLSVMGTVASSAVVAYAFARLKWPGRDIFFGLTLATMMIPFPVLMVPTYALFKYLGWIGSFRPLWVPAFFGSAFNIFLLRQFFRSIPFELSEAAKIDGASEWRTFVDVVLPLAKPALGVVALFTFLGTWTDFLGPLIYLMDQKTFTLSLGLQAYQSQNGGTTWNLLMAATTIVILPVIVVFFFTQKLFIRGIALTGLKG